MASTRQYEALARLRIGDHQDDLEKILGDLAATSGDKNKGYVSLHELEPDDSVSYPFMARVTVDDRIGQVGYYKDFPSEITVMDLSIGMRRDDVLRRLPSAQPSPEHTSIAYGHEGLTAELEEGTRIAVILMEGRLLSMTFDQPDACYSGAMQPEAMKVRDGLQAYDMEMQHRFVDPGNNQGWVFGLPPGITSAQWPLDPVSGYPLMHGFTLLLPEAYRVHGPDIAGLSFFATAADQNDGGASGRKDLAAAVLGAPAEPGESPDLRPFRERAAQAHPHLHRMTDILDYAYAVILLTKAEFNGPLCQPPQLAPNPYLKPDARPEWMTVGAGSAFFSDSGCMGPHSLPVEETYLYKMLGAIPEQRLDWHRAITVRPRRDDPNAGIPPAEVYDEASPSGYQSPYDPEEGYELKSWARDHKPDHIGGTMQPVQATPEFSPFYIGFEEYFGGYNFGSGNAQLDIMQMRFDWACG